MFYKRRQKFFANYMTGLSETYELTVDGEKRLLFAKLEEYKATKKESGRPFRVLEIGAGSGSSMKYYPDGISVTVVDPNPFFEEHFRKSLEKRPGIKFEGYNVAYGEDMSFIEDGSMDAVVGCAVGCSVNDIQQVYKEIKRVLIPEGKYFYMDHIRGRVGSWPYYKQKFMAAFPMWSFINCNCHIDRDLDHQVTLAGFSNIEQRLFEMDTAPYIGFHFISPHVTGVATK